LSSRAAAFLEALRAGQACFNRGDYETGLAAVAPDVRWELAGWVPDGGVLEGREEVRGFFERLGDGIQWTVVAAEASELADGRILVRNEGTAVGRTTGIAHDLEFFAVFELDDQGRVCRVREFETRAEAEAALS
jgi:ketosteroid isomerase-like protein